MGLFGFLGGVASATIKVACTPIAVASDVVTLVTDNEPDATMQLLNSAGDDLEGLVDEIF